jgi:superfamily II DNA or RNA helicase
VTRQRYDGRLDGLLPPYPFRLHQQEALDALHAVTAAGRDRAWVVLPPGAGKRLVGLETARLLRRTTVVLSPNTAVSGQWLAGWSRFLPHADHPARAGVDRELTSAFTALTYQALAVFTADSEVDDDGETQPLLARLHPNGRALLHAMKMAGPLTLVLDECHHLLEVWGRLLDEQSVRGEHRAPAALAVTPTRRSSAA